MIITSIKTKIKNETEMLCTEAEHSQLKNKDEWPDNRNKDEWSDNRNKDEWPDTRKKDRTDKWDDYLLFAGEIAIILQSFSQSRYYCTSLPITHPGINPHWPPQYYRASSLLPTLVSSPSPIPTLQIVKTNSWSTPKYWEYHMFIAPTRHSPGESAITIRGSAYNNHNKNYK